MSTVQRGRYAVVPKLKHFKDAPVFSKPLVLANYPNEQRLALVAAQQRQSELPDFRKFRDYTMKLAGFFGKESEGGVVKPQKILEAGCGLGFDLLAALKDSRVPDGTEIVAVDIDPTALHSAAERLKAFSPELRSRNIKVRLEQADLGNPMQLATLFEPGTFDSVHLANTLVHLEPFDRRRAACVLSCHPELIGPGLTALDCAAALVKEGGCVVTAEGDLRTSMLLSTDPRLTQLDRHVSATAARSRAWASAGADAVCYLHKRLKLERVLLEAQGWVTVAGEAQVAQFEGLKEDPTVAGCLKPAEVDEYVRLSVEAAKAGTHVRTSVSLVGVHKRGSGQKFEFPTHVPRIEGAA